MFNTLAMIEGPTGWVIIGVIVLLLFGGSKIPEMMKGLGTGMREFKKGLKDEEEPPKKELTEGDKDSAKKE